MYIKFKQMSKMTKFTQKTGFSLLPHPVIPSCHPGQCTGITFYIVIPDSVLFDHLVVDAFSVSTSAQPCQNASILARHSPRILFSTYVVMIREWGRDQLTQYPSRHPEGCNPEDNPEGESCSHACMAITEPKGWGFAPSSHILSLRVYPEVLRNFHSQFFELCG